MIHIKATLLFLFVGLVATVLAAVNTTQEFYVVSKVLDGGPKKFDGLYRKLGPIDTLELYGIFILTSSSEQLV